MRGLTVVVLLAAALLAGCSSSRPEWADALNPCCGQDEILAGDRPSEGRCADMVVSREAALSLAWRVAAGSGMTRWRVRLLPGGPACIWKKWPSLEQEDFEHVVVGRDTLGATRSAAAVDSTAATETVDDN